MPGKKFYGNARKGRWGYLGLYWVRAKHNSCNHGKPHGNWASVQLMWCCYMGVLDSPT